MYAPLLLGRTVCEYTCKMRENFSEYASKFKLNEGRSDIKQKKSVLQTDGNKVMHQLKADKGYLRKKLLICFLMKARRPRNLP